MTHPRSSSGTTALVDRIEKAVVLSVIEPCYEGQALPAVSNPISDEHKALIVAILRSHDPAHSESAKQELADQAQALDMGYGGAEAFSPQDAWDELVNKTDRTSPEEYPDHCLISFDELQDFMIRGSVGVAQRQPDPEEAAVEIVHQAREIYENHSGDGAWIAMELAYVKLITAALSPVSSTSLGSAT